MKKYVTPRDLALEMGQSERTVRRVLAEAKIETQIKHHRGANWRFDLNLESDRAAMEIVRRQLANPESKRRYGCRRRRRKRSKVVQIEMLDLRRNLPTPSFSRPVRSRARSASIPQPEGDVGQMKMFD